MKLTLFFSVVLMLNVQASVYSQNSKITLSSKEILLENVLDEIKEQSEFTFLYRSDLLNDIVLDNVEFRKVSLEEILKKVLVERGYDYEIIDKTIIVREASALRYGTTSQQIIVKGKVTDINGNPLPGVNIVEKGTTNGTITNIDGDYTISVSTPEAIISFSYIGFLTEEVNVNGQQLINLMLIEDIQSLEEVVVIGYGTTTRKEFTGSMATVNLENSPIAMSPNINALESLKGSVSGLDIGATNSAGGQPSMQVRGQRSISGSSEPLIVVDGVIYLGDINNINPNDIASFNVLKDATSAAAYGSRSANGVIIISTKKGKKGKPVINLNASGSMQNWHNPPELMGGSQWLDMVRDKNRYDDYSFLSTLQRENYEAGNEVDWFDETSRTGWIQDYQLAVSGAGEKMNYYLSTSYTDNQGIVVGDDFKRISVMEKLTTDITDWLKVGIDGAYTHSDYSGVGANFNGAALLTPYDMPYRDEGQTLLEKYPTGQNEFVNPLWGVDQDNLDDLDVRNNFRMITYSEIKIPWIEGLSYRINYTGSVDYIKSGQFYHENYYAPFGNYDDESRYSLATQQNYLATSHGNRDNVKTTSWLLDNILTYKNRFGKHSIDITAVATRDNKSYKYESLTGTDFSSNGNTALSMDGLHYANTQRITLNNIKHNNIGYLGRLSYAFDDTYYFTASYRKDGSSVFGADRKWGDFFAFGGAWRISNTEFMSGADFIDDMKLKVSWGKNGNQGIAAYGTLSQVNAGSSGGVIYTFGNTSLPAYGINQSTLGNPSLGWETTKAWNFGFESIWLDSRLFVDLDVYLSETTDQIFTRTIPVMTGFTTMLSSMGEVSNKGVELNVNTVNVKNNYFSWSTGLTFWLNRNKLNHLYGDDLNNDGKEDDDVGNSLFIGHSIHSIYGYTQDGIVQTDDTEYMQANGVLAGTPKYSDINGDGVINIDDRSILGYEDANFKLNLSNTFAYKNLSLYCMFSGVFGGNDYYQKANKPAFVAGGSGGGFASNNMYVPYWTEANPSNTYPAAWFTGDDYFLGLQSRAFVRLQDLTLAYTFNQSQLQDSGIRNLKVYFAAKNLFTITGWEGGDPEIGNTINSGIWPVATTLSLGANFSF